MGSIAVQFTWRHTHNENTVEKEHMHDAVEIVYYIRGEGIAIIGGKKYSYKAGTICYIPQGALHSVFCVQYFRRSYWKYRNEYFTR